MSKCTVCAKTIYAAEKQVYDGQDFHGACLQKFKKERIEKGNQPFGAAYQPKEGVEVVVGTKTSDKPEVHTHHEHQEHHGGATTKISPAGANCPVCNKAVYHGEHQTYEGKDYHGACLQKYKKELSQHAAQPFGAQYTQKEGVPVTAGSTHVDDNVHALCGCKHQEGGHATTTKVAPGGPACPECGKTVYHGEHQTWQGQDYHGICLQKVLKRTRDQSQPFGAKYEGKQGVDVVQGSRTCEDEFIKTGGKTAGSCEAGSCGAGSCGADKECCKTGSCATNSGCCKTGTASTKQEGCCAGGSCASNKNTSTSNKSSADEKCGECGKTVYFAERQQYDGNSYHKGCMQVLRKRLQDNGAQPFGAQY